MKMPINSHSKTRNIMKRSEVGRHTCMWKARAQQTDKKEHRRMEKVLS
jgi:hypothetical protein